MRTDHPLAAFDCVRSRIDGQPGHESDIGCAAERLARGLWEKITRQLGCATPRPCPGVMTNVISSSLAAGSGRCMEDQGRPARDRKQGANKVVGCFQAVPDTANASAPPVP
ncbi:hypothetical protein GCM10023170_088260 [Phytohabitans houttuyneae]|uniref:Uncharacterized protein n=1 Tax=Phytohabitans houttuyneae TaxID=1076126 RepID=A0A6V8KMQ3_9ACTN|nr:hypothetical protein Phou_061050 [Phytohabitans houttuyneae]